MTFALLTKGCCNHSVDLDLCGRSAELIFWNMRSLGASGGSKALVSKRPSCFSPLRRTKRRKGGEREEKPRCLKQTLVLEKNALVSATDPCASPHRGGQREGKQEKETKSLGVLNRPLCLSPLRRRKTPWCLPQTLLCFSLKRDICPWS